MNGGIILAVVEAIERTWLSFSWSWCESCNTYMIQDASDFSAWGRDLSGGGYRVEGSGRAGWLLAYG